MFKTIKKICPESPNYKLAERATITKYGTRNKTDLQILRLNLDLTVLEFYPSTHKKV